MHATSHGAGNQWTKAEFSDVTTRQTASGTSRCNMFRLCIRPCRQTHGASASPSRRPLQCCWRKLRRWRSDSGARRSKLQRNARGPGGKGFANVLNLVQVDAQCCRQPRPQRNMSCRAFCRRVCITFPCKQHTPQESAKKMSCRAF